MRQALDFVDRGRFYQAYRVLDNIRYLPDVPSDIFDMFTRNIDQRAALAPGAGTPLINMPEDYLRHPDLGLRAPFRRLHAGAKTPSPFPPSMVMPPLVGVQNDYSFLSDAAVILGPRLQDRLRRAHVVFSSSGAEDLESLLADLSVQTFSGPIHVTVFGAGSTAFASSAKSADRITIEGIDAPLLGSIADRGGIVR